MQRWLHWVDCYQKRVCQQQTSKMKSREGIPSNYTALHHYSHPTTTHLLPWLCPVLPDKKYRDIVLWFQNCHIYHITETLLLTETIWPHEVSSSTPSWTQPVEMLTVNVSDCTSCTMWLAATWWTGLPVRIWFHTFAPLITTGRAVITSESLLPLSSRSSP